jgi:ATP-dependent exoDNAse (exonuclease V) alpha subunit
MSLLNADQQAAADALFAAMMQPGSEYLISGPAGVGKTYLVRHLADNLLSQHTKAMKLMGLPTRYDEVVLTATTNKAAEALAEATGMPVQTIHSFLHLRVSDDYETGTSSIKKTKAWEVYSNKIVVIDEAYLIDPVVQGFIQQALHNCLVIYVGDHCQLPPVMEAVSPIQKRRIAYSALTQPVRNADQPELQELCQVLRTAVETGQLPSIFPLHKTVIRHLDDAGLQAALTAEFSQEGNTRVLAYTNKRVQDFNQYIRENIQGKTERFSVGETYVSNTAIFADTRPVFATEECVLLEEVRAAQ